MHEGPGQQYSTVPATAHVIGLPELLPAQDLDVTATLSDLVQGGRVSLQLEAVKGDLAGRRRHSRSEQRQVNIADTAGLFKAQLV